MSETVQAPAAGPGAGALLRAARENAGVHIASLAVALKVPVARLEALEAERFDLLPDPPFVRALAGSICRALKTDPAPVLALLPHRNPPSLNPDLPRTDGATFRTPSSAPVLAGVRSGLRHPVLWLVLVILVAAAGLMLVPTARLEAWTQALTSPRTAGTPELPPGAVPDTPVMPGEPPVAAVAPMGPESSRGEGGTAADTTIAASPPVSAQAPSAAVAAAPVAATGAAASTAAVSAATPPPSTGAVSFSATAESWVRVTDSRGTTVFEKVLQPGSAQSADGSPPLSVVVGNAGATVVKVRGQAFDLSAITRNNVARFEVR